MLEREAKLGGGGMFMGNFGRDEGTTEVVSDCPVRKKENPMQVVRKIRENLSNDFIFNDVRFHTFRIKRFLFQPLS